jgi:hypothetical protein
VSPYLFDTSAEAWPDMRTARAHGAELLRWQDHDYLVVNDGNGLQLWSIDSPTTPVLTTSRSMVCIGFGCVYFPIDAHGYNLYNFSFCDDCRYGLANFSSAGTVLIDLGEGPAPSLTNVAHYPEGRGWGGLTFVHANQQYMILTGLPGGCGSATPWPEPTLYQVDGLSDDDLTPIACASSSDGTSLRVVGGHYLASDTAAYLYLVDDTSRVHIFEIEDGEAGPELVYQSTPMTAAMLHGKGLRIDPASQIAVSTNQLETTLWDISDPGSPTELVSFVPEPGPMNMAAIGYPYLWLGSKGNQTAVTYDISVLTDPQPIGVDLWDPAGWSLTESRIFDAVISRDRSALYLARDSVLAQINIGSCVSAPPIADLAVNPNPVYPDQSIKVTNISAGQWQRSAMWITDAEDNVVAGQQTMSELTEATLTMGISRELASTQSYTVHVTVESDSHPLDESEPGTQLISQPIKIDRRPAVSILATPAIAHVGEKVTLKAVALGTPNGAGTNPYSWTITPPSGAPMMPHGHKVNIDLDQAGDWQIMVAAQYQHEAAEDQLYQGVASLVIPVFADPEKALPSVAHISGEDSFFTSRIDLFNAGDQELQVEAFFTPRTHTEGERAISVFTVPPHQMQVIGSPLQDWFGFEEWQEGVGSVMLAVRNGNPESLLLQSVVYAVKGATGPGGPGPHFGQYFPASATSEAISEGETVYINTSAEQFPRVRINLGLMSLADGSMVRTTPVSPLGVELSNGTIRTLDRGRNNQLNNFSALYQLPFGVPYLIKIEVITGKILAYVSVIDGTYGRAGSGTGDPTTVLPPRSIGHQVTLLELGSFQGIDEFRGSAVITNYSDHEVEVVADFYARDEPGVSATASISIPTGETVGYIDIAAELFGINNQLGTVVLTAGESDQIYATGREAAVFRNALGEIAGTAGQLMRGLSDDDLLVPGVTYHLLGLSHKQTVRGLERSHVAAFNPGDSDVELTMRMYDGTTGAYEGMIARTVRSQELIQVNSIVHLILPRQNGEFKRIEVTTDGEVFVQGFRVNQDGDPVTIDALAGP